MYYPDQLNIFCLIPIDYMSKNSKTECNPFPMKNNETYPSCKTETQSQTVINAAYDSFQDYIGSGGHMKTCQKLQYKGQIGKTNALKISVGILL